MVDPERRSMEPRLRALLEQVPAVVYTQAIAEPGTPAPRDYVSPQVEGMFGYPAEDWTRGGSSEDFWLSVIHPDDREWVRRINDEADSESKPFRAEYRIVTADGRVVWVRDEGIPVEDPEDGTIVFQGMIIDITEAKLAEEQLHELEGRFRLIVENSPGVTFMDAAGAEAKDTPTLYISPQIETLTGYTQEEWIADNSLWEKLLHPDDRARVLAVDEASYPLGSRYSIEYRIIHRNGHTVWVHDETELLHNEEGEPLYWMGTMYDITAAKVAEQQLREAERTFRTTVEQIPVVVYIDRIGTGKTLYMSPRLESFLGYSPEEWKADDGIWGQSIHPEDLERVMAANEEVERTLSPFLERYRMVRRDGSVIWVEDRCVAVPDESGKLAYWHGVFYDITEQVRAEALEGELQIERETSQRLRELDEMKNTFLSAVSHDLRTPLTSILGLASTLSNPTIELAEEDRALFLQRIMANATKLNSLVTDLLDLDRLSSGAVELAKRPTDLGELVGRVAREQQALDDEHKVEIDVESAIVPMDAPKVERVVENLIANAIRHTPEGTHVWVRTRADVGGALLIVEDDGPGVPAHMRDAIFEAFRQIPGGRTAHGPGVGIGLALVRRMTELHGGRAWVEERPGGGASFRVFLPAA
jgi:PAS domain S-box-containing protein